MSILTAIPIIGQILKPIFDIIDKAVPDKDLAQNLKHQIEMADFNMALQEAQFKKEIIVEELKQEDKFTKRARPTVIYTGIAAIVFNYCFIPLLKTIMQVVAQLTDRVLIIAPEPFLLPEGFWWAWGGLVTTYVIGRSFEKNGYGNKIVGLITGNGEK